MGYKQTFVEPWKSSGTRWSWYGKFNSLSKYDAENVSRKWIDDEDKKYKFWEYPW